MAEIRTNNQGETKWSFTNVCHHRHALSTTTETTGEGKTENPAQQMDRGLPSTSCKTPSCSEAQR